MMRRLPLILPAMLALVATLSASRADAVPDTKWNRLYKLALTQPHRTTTECGANGICVYELILTGTSFKLVTVREGAYAEFFVCDTKRRPACKRFDVEHLPK